MTMENPYSGNRSRGLSVPLSKPKTGMRFLGAWKNLKRSPSRLKSVILTLIKEISESWHQGEVLSTSNDLRNRLDFAETLIQKQNEQINKLQDALLVREKLEPRSQEPLKGMKSAFPGFQVTEDEEVEGLTDHAVIMHQEEK